MQSQVDFANISNNRIFLQHVGYKYVPNIWRLLTRNKEGGGGSRGVLLLGNEGDTLPFQKFLGLPGVGA